MIAYELLCEAIADWKSGQRPTASAPPAGTPETYEDVESYEVVADDLVADEQEVVETSDDLPLDADEAGYASEESLEADPEAEPPVAEEDEMVLADDEY